MLFAFVIIFDVRVLLIVVILLLIVVKLLFVIVKSFCKFVISSLIPVILFRFVSILVQIRDRLLVMPSI
jgi:hypothetical protein